MVSQGLPVIEIPFLELHKGFRSVFYLPALLINSIRLLRVVSQQNIRLVHVNDVYNLCGVVMKLFRPKLRLVYHIRLLSTSYLKPVYPMLTRIVLWFADAVICNSAAVKRGLPFITEKVSVIGNPVNTTELHPPKVFRAVSTLLVLANYVPGKGHDYALEAFARAKLQLPHLRLIMAGGTFGLHANEQYKKQLQARSVALGVDQHVEFRDFQLDIERLIKDSDIVLQFSDSESFSRVSAEAMQYGVPVIAVNSGGPSELIQHRKTGMLVNQGDVPAMTEAIISLAEDAILYRNISTEARTFIIDNFKADFIANQIEGVYRKFLF
ncbi:MAG: glycosyltransferase family 4 protein [Cyclobacteriaceae bacterium]|nr:glycosyltransferase family 4 protein [Cyclobacteriaceae bacterium]